MDIEQELFECINQLKKSYGHFYPNAIKYLEKYIKELKNKKECIICDGTGVLGFGSMMENKCQKCHGTGRI